MALYIDSAYIDDIADVCSAFPITGITTNPSILLAAHERGQTLSDLDVLRQALQLCDGPVFMQPMAEDADGLRAAAERYVSVAPERVVLKLSLLQGGLSVGMNLKRQGARISFTAVYSLPQAYCGLLADADWIIPYVGRLRRAGIDPQSRITQMAQLITAQQAGTRILAASVKTPNDIAEATLAGAHDITAPPEGIRALSSDPLTVAAFAQFAKDWQRFTT